MKFNFAARVLPILTFSLWGMADAGDWPMWRYNAGRGASTPHALPEGELHLQWTRELPEPSPAWPVTQAKLQFDIQAEPVVMGTRIFVPSSRNDSVTAFDTRSGKMLWRYFADGPVRFAPIAHQGKVIFNSDDGHLYAVDAESGKEIWKTNGAPDRRWLLGNHRLISAWPSRGGPVLHEDRVYFAASIWPFMGIFVHAVDPDTGKTIWTNSGDGTNYTVQPHGAPAFAGVVPQGHLAATGNKLVVPGGRSTPAVYDTETGTQLHFKYDKRNGGHNVMASRDLLYVAGHAYQIVDGKPVGGGAPAVFDERMMIASDPKSILARKTNPKFATRETTDRRGKKIKEQTLNYETLFQTSLEQSMPGRVIIKAGKRLFSGGPNRITSWDLQDPEPAWTTEINGEVYSMLAADDRLFVVTREGKLHCYGKDKVEPAIHALPNAGLAETGDSWKEKARQILQIPGTSEGYALVAGIGSGQLIGELLRQSDLHLIVFDPDREAVHRFRHQMADANLYGKRVAAVVGDLAKEKLPPYLCNLITSEAPFPSAKTAFHSLRPYGGAAVFPEDRQFTEQVKEADFDTATLTDRAGFSILTRVGALPDSDDWTHQYANASQTAVSREGNVKAPFGILWFGGPPHSGILPRHGHGPSPQVAGGRLFIEGADMLRAVDVYTGRLLWEKELPGFGDYYNTTAHFAGAGEIGSNYVSLGDRVYGVMGNRILSLDAATGETETEFKTESFWGHISVEGDYLVATSAPVSIDKTKEKSGSIPIDGKEIIPRHSEWHYLAGKDPEEKWVDRDFKIDRGWRSAKAGFGYGDNDDKTTLNMAGKYSRVYIRKKFSLDTPVENLSLSISYDDAFIAYLNGTEVIRKNVGSGRGASASKVSSHEAKGFESFPIEIRHLNQTGKNILAIEGHNTSLRSSDFTLDPILIAVLKGTKESADKPKASPEIPTTRFSSGSRRLVVFDRNTGEPLWERDAEFNFRHNNIALGSDRVFCIDKLTEARYSALARRGLKMEGKPTLYALDLKTGKVIWKHTEEVFGTFLNYSPEHDLLLQAGSKYRDRARDEIGRGMTVLKGETGEVAWHDPDISYGGPCLLWHDQILTNGSGGFSINLLDGKKSGMTYHRQYGCNTAVGSEHLITFRSGAAGFFDLNTRSGTGNLGGFRSSCTNNLIAANGVLNAPDYTRTCSCSYQNQTSLALIHMPEAEFWTYGGQAEPHRIGLNFGAPGDRRSEKGTLFCEYPEVGGKSETAPVKIEGDTRVYRSHSSLLSEASDPWLTSSSVEGIRKLSIGIPEGFRDREGTVTLWFPSTTPYRAPVKHVFDISIEGTVVAKSFDPGVDAKGIVKTFPNLKCEGDQVEIEFRPIGDSEPVLSATEIVFQP